MKIAVYSFHKGIAEHRFDHNNTIAICNELEAKGYEVIRYEYSGQDAFVYEGVTINQGSILIFEDVEHGTFRTYDFGDHPTLTVELSRSPRFVGAVIGQYNPAYWDSIVSPSIRPHVVGGPYPDTVWQLGENYDAVQAGRAAMKLDKRLYWRGSLYSSGVEARYLGVRKALELLPTNLNSDELYFGAGPLEFNQYLQEAFRFRLAFSIGGGGGALCGDLCFRDIEMFGLGVPLMRPKLVVENSEPLIPDFHYVAVDAEFDPEYRYSNPEELSRRITTRYREVIDDLEFLDFVKNNAKTWYENNISYPKITYNIIKALDI